MHRNNTSVVIDFFLPQVQANSRRDVLEIVADEMSAHLLVARDNLLDDMLKHEQSCPSGVGEKVAVMHLPVQGLFVMRTMLLTLTHPVNFHASDAIASNIFCLVLTPADEKSLALPYVSRVIRALTTAQSQKYLREAKNMRDLDAIFMQTDNFMKAA